MADEQIFWSPRSDSRAAGNGTRQTGWQRNRKLDCDRMDSWQVLRCNFCDPHSPLCGVLRRSVPCLAFLRQCHHQRDSSTGLQARLRAQQIIVPPWPDWSLCRCTIVALIPLITPHTAAHRHMEGYVRFSSSSPPANPQQQGNRRFSFQDSPSIDSTDSAYSQSPQQQQAAAGAAPGAWRRSSAWSGSSGWSWPAPLQQLVQRWRAPAHPPQAAYQSNYMTLVPLSGEGGSAAGGGGHLPASMNAQWPPPVPRLQRRQAGRQPVRQAQPRGGCY